MDCLLFGGTHGNEWIGAYLLHDSEITDLEKGGRLKAILANPQAFEQNRRFIQEDLNRSFSAEKKSQPMDILERKRALEIVALIEAHQPRLVIDLHTTTSNMGNTIIFSKRTPEMLALLARVKKHLPDIVLSYSTDLPNQYLINQAPMGVIIEIGPVAQNTLNAKIYFQMKETILTFIRELQNVSADTKEVHVLEAFQTVGHIQYLYDQNGGLNSMVHPERQGKDFVKISKGDPLMITFSGETIRYESQEKDDEDIYPSFINEAAYYPYKIAMELTKKVVIS